CCGKAKVESATFCFRSERERPGYRMGLHNDINWCMANANKGYHCTVSVLVGLADA
ncbi:TPA: amine dehydrogenase, partial [Serratia marcescens]|nr:amine dehydrogenase [Serratia marcescens]